MRHLTTDELVDLAEGTRAPSTTPHLDMCETCRQQLAELTAVMSAVARFEVPEPSPLFWDHLSARVREAVTAEHVPGGAPWFAGWSWPRIVVPVAGAAVVALVVLMVATQGGHPAAPTTPSGLVGTQPFGAPETLASDVPVDDQSLGLVAGLTSDIDWDTARDAGLTVDGSAEHAVTHLTQGELRELQRLLQMELGRPGA